MCINMHSAYCIHNTYANNVQCTLYNVHTTYRIVYTHVSIKYAEKRILVM